MDRMNSKNQKERKIKHTFKNQVKRKKIVKLVLLTIEIEKAFEEQLYLPCSMWQVAMQGPIKRGREGNKTGQKMSKFKGRRKESKGTSEVRRQRHCVHATIKAVPTLSTRRAPRKTLLLPPPQTHTHTASGPKKGAMAGGLLLDGEKGALREHKWCD